MDDALAGHAFPLAGGAISFRCGAAPEEGGLLFRVRRVWVFSCGPIYDFVYVIPGAWVEDVVKAGYFALAEDW